MFPHTEALLRTEYPAKIDETETPLSATEQLFRMNGCSIGEDLCFWCLNNSKKPFDFFVAHVLDTLEHPEQTDLCGEYHQMTAWSDSLYYSDLTLAGTPEWYLTDSALAAFEKRRSPSRVREMEVARRVRKFIEKRNDDTENTDTENIDTVPGVRKHDVNTFLPAYLASEASAFATRRKTRSSARRSEM